MQTSSDGLDVNVDEQYRKKMNAGNKISHKIQ